MNPETVQLSLYSMIKEADFLTDLSRDVLYTYTEQILLYNDLNPSDIKEVGFEYFGKNSKVLYSDTSKLIMSKNFKEDVLSIYNGISDNYNEECTSLIRIECDSLANKKGVLVEELLNNDSYINDMKTEIESINKALGYYEVIDGLDDDSSKKLFDKIIKE